MRSYRWRINIVVGFLVGLTVSFSACTESQPGKKVNYTPKESSSSSDTVSSSKGIFTFLEPLTGAWSEEPVEEHIDLDSLISVNVVSFTNKRGDLYRILIKCFTNEAPITIAQILAQPNCYFTVGENSILNTIVNITAYKNNKLFFSKDISKDEFKNIVDRRFLKLHQFVGADLFTYNERYNQCIFRLNLAQREGGTEWFAQVYYVVNDEGKVVTKGLCDYPFHCQDIMSLSADGKYLLTCSEIINLAKPARRKFNKASVVMSKFINDSLFTLVYDMMRDSVVCDTTIYWKEDTLTYQHKIPIPDTTSHNAYIVHVKGDTLAKFPFKGYATGSQGYYTQYAPLNKLNLVGYYDRSKRVLRVFDVSGGMKEKVYHQNKLNYIALSPNYDSYFEFNTTNDKGKDVKLRFFVNNLKKVVGYSLI